MIGKLRNWTYNLIGRGTNPLLSRVEKEQRARQGVRVSRKEAVSFPPFARTITVIATTVAKYMISSSVYPKEGRESISSDGKKLEVALWGSLDNGLHSTFEKLVADIIDYLIEGYSLNLVMRQPNNRKYPFYFSNAVGNMVLQKEGGVPIFWVGGKPYTPTEALAVTFRDMMQEKRVDGMQTHKWIDSPRPVPSNLDVLRSPLNTGIAIWNALEDYFGSRLAVYLLDTMTFEKEMTEKVRDEFYGQLNIAAKQNLPFMSGGKGQRIPPGEIGAVVSLLETLKHSVHTIHTFYGISPLMMGTSMVERGAGLGRISDIDHAYCFDIHLKKFLSAYKRFFLAIGESLVPNRLENMVGSDNLAQVLQQLRPDPGQQVGPIVSDHEIRKYILGMRFDKKYLEEKEMVMPMADPQLEVVGSIGENVEDWRDSEKLIAL